jgi:apolipoprotein N-acyltransferase
LILSFTAPPSQSTIRVAALQPNFDKPAFQDTALSDENRIEIYGDMIREAAARGARIVFTPEMAFNFDPQMDHSKEFISLTRETGVYLFINYTVSKEGEAWRNEVILLSPDGIFYNPAYGKNHTPPGESRSLVTGIYPVYSTPLGKVAALICHDGNYTDIARKLTLNGAQLISAGLNEFGGFGEQYWTNLTFRAVENRIAVIVTSRQSGSAIIDAMGRQIALDINPKTRTILLGDLPLQVSGTAFTRIGDLIGWISLAGFIFFIIFSIVLSSRGKMKAN